MGRFSSMTDIEQAVSSASLTKPKSIKKNEKKSILVHGVNQEWHDAIEASGESFSGFAKRAIYAQLKREGIIST